MTDPDPSPARSWLPTPRRLALVAFPIILWLFATMALGGALGKSTDDYSTNLRDPVTNALNGGFEPFHEYSYFWRPAHIFIIHALQSALWEHDRFIHLLGAAAHGLVAWLLYRLLWRVLSDRAAAYAVSMVFLVLPVHFEAVFFTSTIGTLIAAALWLWLAIAAVRYIEAPPAARGRTWLPALAAIALAIPFFYEQPGAAIIAFPLLLLAASPRSRPLASRIRQTVVVTTCMLATQGAMLGALLLTAPPSRRGSASSLIPSSAWAGALRRTIAQGLDLAVGDSGRQIARGALELGWRSLSTSSLWVWLVPVGLSGAAVLLAIARRPSPDACGTEDAPAPPRRSLLVSLFGLVAALASLLPVALVAGQSVAPRLTYMPALGLCIAAGGLLSALLRGLGDTTRRRVCVLASPGLVAFSVLGAVCLVGTQQWFQLRARADAAIAEQLRALAPTPPSGTIFVPVRIDSDPARTGISRFDRLRPGAFETIWSATAITRQRFRRRDLWAAGWNPWRVPTLRDPTPDEVLLNDRFVIWSPFSTDEAQTSTRLPWSSVVPFTVDPSGRVRLIRRIVIEDERAEQVIVTPALTADASPASPSHPTPNRPTGDTSDQRILQATLWLSDTRPDATLQPVSGWQFASSRGGGPAESPAEFAPHTLWGRSWPSMWLHPTADSGGRGAIAAMLPPSESARRVIIRATMAGYDLERAAVGSSDILRLESSNGAASELRLPPQRIRREQRWIPLVVTVPPSQAPVQLRVTLRAADGSPGTGVPVWVSSGLVGPDRSRP